MKLICPECSLVQSRSFASMRLETCVRCARKGREVYLVRADGIRNPGRRPLIDRLARRRD